MSASLSAPELYCHLPGLRLADDAALESEPGWQLSKLAFADWLALEDPALSQQERRYEHIAPIFLRARLPEGGVAGELTSEQEQAIRDLAARAQVALLVALPQLPAVDPALSTAYVVWRDLPVLPERADGFFGPESCDPVALEDDDGLSLGKIVCWLKQTPPGSVQPECWAVQRRFGPHQREWLLANPMDLPPITAAESRAWAEIFERTGRAAWGPRRVVADRCADVMAALMRGGTSTVELVVSFVAALENLVNSEATSPLGATFAQRCSSLMAESWGELESVRAQFRALYGSRSDVIHGLPPAPAIRSLRDACGVADERQLRHWLAQRAYRLLRVLVSWYERHPEDDAAATEFRRQLTLSTTASTEAEWQAHLVELLRRRRA